MAEKKKLHNPYSLTGDVGDRIVPEYETEYKSIKIVDVVKKIGEGENDFIIEKKVIEDFTPIQDVIDADKESVGVENIIKQVMRTGDSTLFPMDKGDCNVDLVGAPENLMEVKQLGIDAEAAFNKLPEGLVNGMDMKSFVNSMTQEQFDAFIKATQERLMPKGEDNNG